MKRLTITLAVLAACTLAAGSVSAKGKGNGGGNSGGNSGGRSIGMPRGNFSGNHLQKQVTTQKFDKHVTTPKFDNRVLHSQKLQHSQKVQLNHVVKNKSFTIAHCPTKHWKKCDFGYCFHGKACGHWEHKCWYPTYGCYFYYCPYTYVEYWFCVEDDCYYPVGYCPVAYRLKYKFGW